MTDKTKLSDMLDNLVNDNQDEAQANFHDFLQTRVQEILGKGTEPESGENNSVSDKE
jgi:hypothetical protein